MISVSQLVRSIASELNDFEPGFEHTRWPLQNLLDAVYEGLTQIYRQRPDQFAKVGQMTLAVGPVQNLPLEFSAMLSYIGTIKDGVLVRTGSFGGDKLTRHLRECPRSDGSKAVSIDPSTGRIFYVSPPVAPGDDIQISFIGAVPPEPVASGQTTIEFAGGDSAPFFNAIKDYALYRLFAYDTESASSLSRSQAHFSTYQVFMNPKKA